MCTLFSYFNLYLGVAKAFNDTTFLHPEMEELIRMYFKDVNEATLKLGQVRVHCMYVLYQYLFRYFLGILEIMRCHMLLFCSINVNVRFCGYGLRKA